MSDNKDKSCPLCGAERLEPEKRIFKESEIVTICKNPEHFAKCRDEIMVAQREKRIMMGI